MCKIFIEGCVTEILQKRHPKVPFGYWVTRLPTPWSSSS